MKRDEGLDRSSHSARPDAAPPPSKTPTRASGKSTGRRTTPHKPADTSDQDLFVRRQIAAVRAKLVKLPPESPNGSQDLAGRLALALSTIEDEEAFHLLHVVDFAASAIAGTSPNLRLVRRIVDGVERQLLLRRKVRYVMQGLGIGLLITLVLTVLAWLYTPASTGFDRIELGLVALAGFVGASVSLAIKIGNYARLKDVDTRVLRWTALFKPLIGMVFALFIYMALNSGIVAIELGGTSRNYFFVAMAFIAGFSERFAKDVITRVERSSGEEAGEPITDWQEDGQVAVARELEEHLQADRVSENDRKRAGRR